MSADTSPLDLKPMRTCHDRTYLGSGSTFPACPAEGAADPGVEELERLSKKRTHLKSLIKKVKVMNMKAHIHQPFMDAFFCSILNFRQCIDCTINIIELISGAYIITLKMMWKHMQWV